MNTTLNVIPWSSDLKNLAARFGEATAVATSDARLSYRELSVRAHALAARLAQLGITPGQAVATSLPNSVQAVWASYGVTLSGAAETPLSAGYTDAEIAWFAALARFRVVVTTKARAAAFAAMDFTPIAVDDIEASDQSPFAGDKGALPPVDSGVWGRILSSSGTTGEPKAIVYTHERRWLAHTLLKAALPFTPQPGARLLLMTPFPHGASLMSFAWLDYGGEVILEAGVDAGRIRPLLERGDVEAVFAPPTVIAKLAESFGEQHFRGVRCVFTGTQTLTAALYAKARALFGPVVRITYGKAELINPITVLDPADTETLFSNEAINEGACVGWPAPGVEIEIRAEEIHLRGRHMSIGFIDSTGFHDHGVDGFHATGDIGQIDEHGRLWLKGRMADVIKTGGYKVHPQEIEAALSALDECGQVCIASLPSDYWGEVIVAVTEQARGDWRGQCETRLAQLSKHKRPRAYIELDRLPRNPQGKISRRQLREAILCYHELIDGPHPRLVKKGS